MFSRPVSQNDPDEDMCTYQHLFFNPIIMTNFVISLSFCDKYTNTFDVAYQRQSLLPTATENTPALTVLKHAPKVLGLWSAGL